MAGVTFTHIQREMYVDEDLSSSRTVTNKLHPLLLMMMISLPPSVLRWPTRLQTVVLMMAAVVMMLVAVASVSPVMAICG